MSGYASNAITPSRRAIKSPPMLGSFAVHFGKNVDKYVFDQFV